MCRAGVSRTKKKKYNATERADKKKKDQLSNKVFHSLFSLFSRSLTMWAWVTDKEKIHKKKKKSNVNEIVKKKEREKKKNERL